MSLSAGRLSDHGHLVPPAAFERADRRGGLRRCRRLLLLLSPVAVVAAAAIVLAVLASSYQPVGPGSSGGGSFPGIPAGAGIHWENGLAVPTAELYVPPQRGTFALAGSIRNNGTYPVIIEAVTQPPGSPLIPAGLVLYNRGGALAPVHGLRNLTLGPAQGIEIGMPLRTAPSGFRHNAFSSFPSSSGSDSCSSPVRWRSRSSTAGSS